MKPYFSVHTHTTYSNIRLIDSINQPEALIDKAIELGLSGLAITDHECVSAHVRAEKYMNSLKEKHPDFKLAFGNEIYLTDTRDSGQKYYHFILIAKDEIGHRALRELSSRAWLNSYTDRKIERVPTLKTELEEIVHKFPGHLIATTACIGGELPQNILLYLMARKINDNNNAIFYYKKIMDFLDYCQNLFKEDFYIECAPGTSAE
jgi:DNA polymerase-3 subunit alpha